MIVDITMLSLLSSNEKKENKVIVSTVLFCFL